MVYILKQEYFKLFSYIFNNFIFHRREVSFEEGLKLAEANDLQFIETSAKNGENVEQAFGIATANVLRKIEMGEINPLSDVYILTSNKFYSSINRHSE